MRTGIAAFLLVLLVGCDRGSTTHATHALGSAASPARDEAASRPDASPASAPDQGSLVEYGTSAPVRMGATTWYPVRLSEEHAVRAIATGGMDVEVPGEAPVRLKYERHIEHEDGNWTWIGRVAGSAPGTEAILTFGERAVFAVIPHGSGEALRITMAHGRAWLVKPLEASPRYERNSSHDDSRSGMAAAEASAVAAAATSDGNTAGVVTVDLALGYTNGFAERLGGQSQALTRMNHLVDVANETYANSAVNGRLRLVSTVQVEYPDATTNRSALFELTGVSCSSAPGGQLPDGGVNCTQVARPASLQPLISARNESGADVVALVRKFESPENGSCGYAWLLGNSQTPILATNAGFGMAVISDTSGTQFPDGGATCREESLAHELGHTMGLQHDAQIAQGTDDSNGDGMLLDPEEYGRYPYSFGYVAPASAGNFYTVMANRRVGVSSMRVFSNPRLTTCNGFACGVAGESDNAGALARTMPFVAAFLPSRDLSAGNWLQGDFDGDGRSDVLWRKANAGNNLYWKGGNSATRQALASVTDLAWIIAGIGDFDGDGKSDVLWRNRSTGANTYWKSANTATRQSVASVTDLAWFVAGIGDFNGDGRSDVLWRNARTGVNVIWNSANSLSRSSVASATLAWTVEAVADFNGDGRADILWRNRETGVNSTWSSANAASRQSSQASPVWLVATAADFNGDGRADLLWRNTNTGSNVLWWSGSSAMRRSITTVGDAGWIVVGAGDFDLDGKADVLWRHNVTGANMIWKGANSGTPLPITAINDLNWVVG
jgi:peptidyl-Asp metalloendopeptidase